MRAHNLFHRDQHYVVSESGEIIIVDEFTGRLMEGRRWSDGLHQAIEAKEGVAVNQENQTLASITFQNYFRLYEKLAGMTGTADTEAYEFQSIYGLETVIIPTNLPMIRQDANDKIFRTAEEKFEAVVADIKACHEQGQPVLVGTTSIENSERVSALLNQEKLAHNVLNAKEHEREAYIIAQAGKPGVITVATNMAGRGTDIVLGGNIDADVKAVEDDETLPESEKAARIEKLRADWQALHDAVIARGGLHIVGTERHESRRIDNQLRGRAGRQGDPGSSRFYLSFEDPLLRLFAMDRAAAILDRLAPERGTAIEHGLLTRQIEGAQRKVEGRNFDIRKQLLEYDDVANDQRKVIYFKRNEILEGTADIGVEAADIRRSVIEGICAQFIPEESMEEEWDAEGLVNTLSGEFGLPPFDIQAWLKEDNTLDSAKIKQRVMEKVEADYAEKTALVGEEAMRGLERNIMLSVIDTKWREHLAVMDQLRQGIHLRGYAQKNPKQEYKREAFALFENLLANIEREVARYLIRVHFEISQSREDAPENAESSALPAQSAAETLPPRVIGDDGQEAGFSPETLAAAGVRIGRNDPCPCGSGRRYKQCHGRLA